MEVGRDETPVVVRAAGLGDAEALAALRFAWQSVELGREGLDSSAYAAALREWMAAHEASHRPFLAERDGRALAMAWLVVVERVPSPSQARRRAAMLQSVYARPECRDAGVGSALVAHVVGVARDEGFEYLMVHPSARSFAFYERLGFAVTNGELELSLDGRPRTR